MSGVKKERLALSLLLTLVLGLAVLFGAGLYLGLRAIGRLEVQMMQLQQAQTSLGEAQQRQEKTLQSAMQREQSLAATVDRLQSDEAQLQQQLQALARCAACAELG